MQPRIGITLGDCAGIGPEIVDLALKSDRLPKSAEYKIIGKYPDCSLGHPTVETARAAAAALEEAVTLARRGELDGIVTGPIHKARMYEAGFKFPGQTEFFAGRCSVKDVAGLNPHAGESGKLGREEIEIISPAIAALKSEIRNPKSASPARTEMTGPHSPDTVFHRAVEGEFDGVLCMYHDQGLIPLKLHAFHSGVNVTLGLPFPRTSPDHGTAFEIAGKGIARPDSMIGAINLAVELAQKVQ